MEVTFESLLKSSGNDDILAGVFSDLEASLETDESANFSKILSRKISPARVQYKAPAGIGKTTKLIDEIANLNVPAVIFFMLPAHDKIAETYQDMLKRDINVVVYRGRNEDNCQRYDFTKKVSSSGGLVGEYACKDCPFFNTCKYQADYQEVKEAQPVEGKPIVYLMTHEHLTFNTKLRDYENPNKSLRPDLLIVDESCWKVFFREYKIKLNDLTSNRIFKNDKIAKYQEFFEWLSDSFDKNTPNMLSKLRKKYSVEYLNELKISLDKFYKSALETAKDEASDDAEFIKILNQLNGTTYYKLYK